MGAKGIATRFTRGDGTVPVVSQPAEFVDHPHGLVAIADHPEHVPAPRREQVWARIVGRVREPAAPSD